MDKENILGLFKFVRLNDDDIEERPTYIRDNGKEIFSSMVAFTKKPLLLSSGGYIYIPIHEHKTLDELKQCALDLVNFSIDDDDRGIEYILENAVLLYRIMPTENQPGMVGLAIL